MSLLDGLKDSLKNPLAENNDEMEFILESDFETALEKAIDVKLSPADIAAILNGDDDIDDEEDDLDDLDDDIDKDTIDDLQKAKEALEATMTEIGIDTAADELDEDDDTGDLDMDPEGEDEIISEEALIEMIDALGCDDAQELPGDEAKITKKADTGESSIPKNSGKLPEDIDKLTHETGDASIPENTQDPTPDGDEHQIKKDEETLEALIAALESDDKPEIDNDPSATECDTTETGAAGTLANADDATPNGDTEEPAGAENDAKDEECDTNACESKKEDSDDDSDDEDSDDDESDDDEDEKKKDKKCKKEDSDDDSDDKDEDDDDSDDDESDECSLESILDSLLENPI